MNKKIAQSAETRRNLHTHTHTHTCNPLKAIKQIGTICFAVFTFIFSSFADPDIASTASTADCKYAPLETYSGTSNLQANWDANTIDLHWYNGDTELTVPSASQSCVYDGTLTPPTTIPTKTGYTFKGWRVRQCSFASSVCGLTGSEVTSLTGESYGAKTNNGQASNASQYGLTENGTWAVEFSGGGVLKGIASCNNTTPNTFNTILDGLINETMTEEQAYNALWGTCNNDTFKPSGAFDTSSTGSNCWCKMTSWTPSVGSACNVASSWVFYSSPGSDSDCASGCAFYCAYLAHGNNLFRRALFGVSQ